MKDKYEVVIIGAGPAGMFAADELVKGGVNDVLILEMGKDMERRRCPETQACNCVVCDMLEGEGGAGGFSDGKKTYSLGRGTQMEEIFNPKYEPILKEIDDIITHYGGEGKAFEPVNEYPEEFEGTELEFGSYPLRHIGSDGVRNLIIGHMKYLNEQGVTTSTRSEVKDLILDGDRIVGVEVYDHITRKSEDIFADQVMVASGLQGSPWFEEVLEDIGVELGVGHAGMGVRIEARYETLKDIFSRFYDFKLMSTHGKLSFRSFCCNQRGYVVNENHKTLGVRNVNGHSYLSEEMRSDSSNFAIICKVGTDYTDNPQEFVRGVARGINALAEGHPVVQTTEDFVNHVASDDVSGGGTRTNFQARSGKDIAEAMPNDMWRGFSEFLIEMDKALPGVVGKESLIYAPEVKYYGRKVPVDFDTWKVKGKEGLYVVGNATGYLDSFVSAALSGMIAAKNIISEKENE